MRPFVRVAVVVVTIALALTSGFYAVAGHREIAVLLALAAPLGLSAWGFARAGIYDAAVVLISCVVVTVVTILLAISPLGMHDHAVIAYAAVLLFDAMLLSRRAFVVMALLTFGAAILVFGLELAGQTASRLGGFNRWHALFDFLLIMVPITVLARFMAELLFERLDEAEHAEDLDPVTRLPNRARFLGLAGERLGSLQPRPGRGVLVVADIIGFRRLNSVVGHAAADGVLAEAARRASAVHADAIVARVGDDELGLLATGLAAREDGERVAQALREALTFEHAGVSVAVHAGWAHYPEDAHRVDSLLLAADAALLRATGK